MIKNRQPLEERVGKVMGLICLIIYGIVAAGTVIGFIYYAVTGKGW